MEIIVDNRTWRFSKHALADFLHIRDAGPLENLVNIEKFELPRLQNVIISEAAKTIEKPASKDHTFSNYEL